MQNAFERSQRSRSRAPLTDAAGAAAEWASQSGSAAASSVPRSASLDAAARQELVELAAGKSTRQVMQMLAGVDPELAAPGERLRALGDGRRELKAVIDAECQRGLEQLRALLSHVDPHLTLGQLVGRLVQEGLDRYDPGRPRRGRRNGKRGSGTGERSLMTAPQDAGRAATSAGKREVWQRAQGRCSYVDRHSGRRCGSRFLLEIDHIVPYALGGGAEPDNLRLVCQAHHRQRHGHRGASER